MAVAPAGGIGRRVSGVSSKYDVRQQHAHRPKTILAGQMNRYAPIAILLWLVVGLSACADNSPVSASPTPTVPVPPCNEDGTIGHGSVPNPTQGYDINFQYYLPPCYATSMKQTYPVIYLLTLGFEGSLNNTDNAPFSLTNRLIRSGKMSPVILIVPTATVGQGYHAALAIDLVPFVDSQFRTIQDAQHRGVGGISHAAAISVRMAFQFPETFGSVGLLSGGIVPEEQDQFASWIARTPPGQWPRVLIDVGDQDPIFNLTTNLLEELDKYHVPYILKRGSGGHTWEYWSSIMESCLLWFAESWK